VPEEAARILDKNGLIEAAKMPPEQIYGLGVRGVRSKSNRRLSQVGSVRVWLKDK
jgi:hypothetical protein